MLGCRSRGSLVSLPWTCQPILYDSSRPLSPSVLVPVRRHVHSKSTGISRSASLNTLSAEQKDILARALRGENIFVTGPSGSGKSHLLKIIAEQFAARKRPYLLTGGTSLSTFDIGGTYLPSFTEGQTVHELHKLQNRRRKDPVSIEYRAKWQRLETILIDDISQIDATLFDGLAKTARKMKSQKVPFGGIQIIASGDFFQLPPESVDMPAPDYAFNATEWGPTFLTNQIELSRVFSKSEPEFIDMLNQARIGKISSRSTELLSSLARSIPGPSIELCPLRVQARTLVSSHLKSLRGEWVQFRARDQRVSAQNTTMSHKLNKRHEEAYDELVSEVLEFKVGAQVISIQDLRLGNIYIPKFTLGTVTDFSTPSEATKLGIPYIWKDHRLKQKWPVVRFENGTKMMVVPVQFRFGDSDGTVRVAGSRTQIPLKLASAGLVHEFQSSNRISRVKVDLSKRFPGGLGEYNQYLN
ncbi:unnamed protein product [Rhizoctonia solani]|uniref:ATP-dependent DNA helicase n=1 Tax=Rhizoctonia solani TaxID=456999 RepID=A0A8H3H249_9AGAM|nr:unnamed protein product [Rhizoctonia solani]